MKMPQRFARPRTPNDNPFIEASFSTVKRDPEYPGRFRDLDEGYGYFNPYLTWYNQEHYHSGIAYVTPDPPSRSRFGGRRKVRRIADSKIGSLLNDRNPSADGLAQRQRRREVNLKEVESVLF